MAILEPRGLLIQDTEFSVLDHQDLPVAQVGFRSDLGRQAARRGFKPLEASLGNLTRSPLHETGRHAAARFTQSPAEIKALIAVDSPRRQPKAVLHGRPADPPAA